MEEELEVPKIPDIPAEQVTSEKWYFHGVYIILKFNKEGGVESKKEHVDVEQDPDEEDIEDVQLDNEWECPWRMIFEDNDGGVDDKN